MTTQNPLKVGLIGCGRVVSYGHGVAVRTLDEVELVGVADITPARREVAKEWFGLPDADIYASHHDLLARSDVEAVIVAAPPRERVELILDSLKAGKHVLTEKPLAPNTAVAAEMIELAEQSGLVFTMCHNYLFHPELRQLKQLIDDGEIGELHMLTIHFLGCQDNTVASVFKPYWKRSDHAGGGIAMDMLHAVYLAEWLFGSAAEQVMAFIDAPTYGEDALNVEDMALLQVAFPRGYASLQLAWGNGVGGIDISGNKGHIRLRNANYGISGSDAPEEMYLVRDGQRTDFTFPPYEGDWMDWVGKTFIGILDDFQRAIRDKTPTIAPAVMGYRALQVVLGAYVSSVTGQTIKLPLEPDNPVHLRGIDGVPELNVWAESRTKRVGIFSLEP